MFAVDGTDDAIYVMRDIASGVLHMRYIADGNTMQSFHKGAYSDIDPFVPIVQQNFKLKMWFNSPDDPSSFAMVLSGLFNVLND